MFSVNFKRTQFVYIINPAANPIWQITIPNNKKLILFNLYVQNTSTAAFTWTFEINDGAWRTIRSISIGAGTRYEYFSPMVFSPNLLIRMQLSPIRTAIITFNYYFENI